MTPLADDARKHAARRPDPATTAAVLGHRPAHAEGFDGPIGDGPQGPPPVTPYRENADAEPVDANLGDDDGVTHNTEPWAALPSIDYTRSGIEVTPPGAPLAQAWSAVMAEVQEIRKEGRFSGGGAN